MKLSQLKTIKWNYKALAFLFPFMGILLVMIISGYHPFGKYSMLYSDMYHQYFPFFKAFRQAILNGESLLYNWDVGMGMDYLGLASYYLASPLNLLSVLVPEPLLLTYFSLLVGIKLGLSSLFFSIFLNKIYGKNDFTITLFGCCYGLCAWALGYQWNIMWLDTFALLPLVALGTVSLLRDKKFILYTLTLFLSIFANYYIGLFTCIFVFLIFFVYEICCFRGFKRFFGDLLRIALFSVLAIGMTAILELPALASLQTTQSSVNQFPQGFKLNITDDDTLLGLLDAMRQVAGNMGGGLEPSFKEGLPNLYCGVGTVALAFLFLFSRGIRIRDKVCSVILLLFFMVSFIIRQLDYIWHGFHFTNMIPYRFSFLFSFVMLNMAYRAWLLRRRFRIWQIITAGILALGVFLCSDERSDPVFLMYNLGLLVLYLMAAVYSFYRGKRPQPVTAAAEESLAEEEQAAPEVILEEAPEEHQDQDDLPAPVSFLEERYHRRKTGKMLLAGLLALEMILNVINFGLCFPGSNVSNYPKGTKYAESVIRYMKEREDDTLFFRAEVTRTQTLNDGALLDYNGVSTFTSSANVSVTKFMKALGFAAKNTYNRYCFEMGSPVTDLFLGLKYLIDRDGNPVNNPYYNDLYHYDKVHLLESNIYLPLGFLAESRLGELDITSSSGEFRFQNDVFKRATGITEPVWTVMEKNHFIVIPTHVELTNTTSQGYCAYVAGANGGQLTYQYTAPQDGFMCVMLNLSDKNDFSIFINDEKVYKDNISLPQITAVGHVQTGDVVEIRMDCDSNENNKMTVNAAILNDDVFRRGYDVLAASTLDLTEFRNTYVAGTIDCNRDGLLYTSIPQNGYWSATVDGEPAEITLVGDAMIGLNLTKGTHTVEFSYHNSAFALGWKISLGCAMIFGVITLLVYKPKRYKGKFEK